MPVVITVKAAKVLPTMMVNSAIPTQYATTPASWFPSGTILRCRPRRPPDAGAGEHHPQHGEELRQQPDRTYLLDHPVGLGHHDTGRSPRHVPTRCPGPGSRRSRSTAIPTGHRTVPTWRSRPRSRRGTRRGRTASSRADGRRPSRSSVAPSSSVPASRPGKRQPGDDEEQDPDDPVREDRAEREDAADQHPERGRG